MEDLLEGVLELFVECVYFFTRIMLDLLPEKVKHWLDTQNIFGTKLIKVIMKILAICCSMLLAAVLFVPLFLIIWLLLWKFWK